MSKVIRYLLNLAVLLDEAANTILGGSPNETISERSAKARAAGRRWGCVLCELARQAQPRPLRPRTYVDDRR